MPEKESTPETCLYCRHFRYNTDRDRDGECHRYPQAVRKGKNDTCGEWEKK